MYMLAGFRAFQASAPVACSRWHLRLPATSWLRGNGKVPGLLRGNVCSASVLGPVVGGALAGQNTLLGIDGWRWIFLINVPIGLVTLVVVSKVLHIGHVRREHRVDYAGAISLVIALVPLLIVAEQGQTWAGVRCRPMHAT